MSNRFMSSTKWNASDSRCLASTSILIHWASAFYTMKAIRWSDPPDNMLHFRLVMNSSEFKRIKKTKAISCLENIPSHGYVSDSNQVYIDRYGLHFVEVPPRLTLFTV